jgi:hypothetical protein
LTDSPVTPDVEDTTEDGPTAVHCRHCGQQNDVDVEATPDWLCPSCGRYQDATICPTCHQLARISLLPAEVVPEPHAPAKRKRSS